jgi:hypothetical protein
MKEILGYLLITQAILTGIIVYSIIKLSDSIKASAHFITTGEGQLSWGSEFGVPIFTLILLIAVAGFGVFLIITKK